MSCIFAFQDEYGEWHGRSDTPPFQGGMHQLVMTYTPDRRSSAYQNPFSGQRLVTLCTHEEVGVPGFTYESDDGSPLSATWQVCELLDDPSPDEKFSRSLPGELKKPPMFARSPSMEIEVYEGSYDMDVWELQSGNFYVEVFGRSSQIEPTSLIRGEVDPGGLALIGRLFTDAAQRSGVPQSGRASRTNDPWLESDTRRLEELDDAGYDVHVIGMKLGRTDASIRWRLHHLGRAPFPTDLINSRYGDRGVARN